MHKNRETNGSKKQQIENRLGYFLLYINNLYQKYQCNIANSFLAATNSYFDGTDEHLKNFCIIIIC